MNFPRVRPPGKGLMNSMPVAESRPAAPVLEKRERPTEGREFPCDRCGAALRFDPGAQALTCDHCGNVQRIPQSAEAVEELSYERYFHHGYVAEEVLANVAGERRCDGCGAMVVFSADTVTDQCPFCATHLTAPLESPMPMMRPGAVLPFAIERRTAKDKFRDWVKSRWFAPNDFRKVDSLNQLNGLYVPHWTYDAMTFSYYTGQRGDYYYVTVGSGENSRQERRTRWRSVSGRVDHWFDDILICASRSLPPKLMHDAGPWDLKAARPYDPGYLSGFRTERYQVSVREGFNAANEVMAAYIRQLVKADIGGDEQRISTLKTQLTGIKFKLILLPIWMSAYHYKGRIYRVVVNARTGEVQGERPWSAAKITLFTLFVLAIVVPLVLAIAGR